MNTEGALFIVLVILDPCVSAVEDDFSMSRVFNSYDEAVRYYKAQRKIHFINDQSVDYIGLYRGEFKNRMLVCGDRILSSGFHQKVKKI